MRKRSVFLIALGGVFVLVAVLGAFFPFVPIIFSDAKYLSDEAARLAADEGELASDESPTATTSIQTTPSNPSASGAPATSATPAPQENRLFIEKIGVSVPVVEGKNAGAMLYGAWRYPGTSRPQKGSNTVLFGHRFRYLPPNNTTFYHLDKMRVGDIFSIRWLSKTYHYKVAETKIIQPTDFSVVQPTEKPTVTLITCAPLFTTKERLVVVGELIE